MKSEDTERGHRKERLGLAIAITVVLLVVEVVGGFLAGSLALLADAAHVLTDVGALVISYVAMRVAERRPTKRHTFGFHRAEILAAFINAELLLLISGGIFYEAFGRLLEPPEIRTGLMMGVAVAGLAANLIVMRLLHGHHEKSLNVKAAYLEVLTDTLASVGVICGALLMAGTGWYWIDAVVSAGIGVIIVPRTLHLLRESAHILLEGSPSDVDLPGLREEVLAIRGVVELHDLHVWTLTSGFHSASVHIRAAEASPRGEVLRAVRRCLLEKAGVDHATVQVEWGPQTTCETTEHEYW